MNGRFGQFGGAYVSALLVDTLAALTDAFHAAIADPDFSVQLADLLRNYAGRETALTHVKRFSEAIAGPSIYLKREDLLHTGAHKINNALGQCLLAKRMGKQRVLAETGAGQHGVATATACAYFGLGCDIYMGAVDVERQAPNVAKMKLLGANVIAVDEGDKTLRAAVNAGLRAWSSSTETTHYCVGSALGPHPFPEMVEYFQSVIGVETRRQCHEAFGRDPDLIIACVGGGSNAIGIFHEFLSDDEVKLVGVEAGGRGVDMGQHAARFQGGKPGILHGSLSYMLQDADGQAMETHSISAGLDYSGVGPKHAFLFEEERVMYVSANDDQVMHAFKLLSKTEGIIPALESSHALAYLVQIAPNLPKDFQVVVNLSGRGDKDLPQLFAGGLL